jgi:hypothetical protein
MTKTKTLISFKLVRIVPFLLLSSCMVQLSTVPKIKNTMISSVNTAIIAVSADYKMNMSSSRDVKFYFKEINTGKIIAPDYRDDEFTNMYFNIEPGEYRILLITIKEPTIAKSIVFNDSTKTITKTIGLANVNQFHNPMAGLSFSGVILTGDKNLVYSDTISNVIKIEPNSAYFLGEYQFEGYIEGMFNDMPNIRITKKVAPSPSKIASFKKISNETYQTSSIEIKTNENIFNTDLIDLSKSNSITVK